MSTCRMIVKNSISELENIAQALENYFDQNNLSPTSLFEVNLAIEEVFTNIVFYAFPDKDEHQISILLEKEGNLLTIKIEDSGVPFNPLFKAEPDFEKPLSEREIGGLGIHLIKKMMDNVEYSRTHHKNILTLYKNLPVLTRN
ncbi:MAG: ATP-binding protein [Bacteroidales bacterium]